MRKRLLAMALTICMVLAIFSIPAMADGSGETAVGFWISDHSQMYPYGTPASGSGWSYDGKNTFTLSGVNLGISYDADTMIQFCNPDRNISIVAAPGTVSTFGSIGTMYRMNSTRRITVNVSGTGELHCRSFAMGGETVVFSDATVICDSELYCDKLTMNSGYIDTELLSIGADSALNGGGILVHGVEVSQYTTNSIRIATKDQSAGQALAGKFTDQYGQPLRFEVKEYTDYSVAYIYDSKGEYAYYARFGSVPEPTVGNFKDVKQSAWYAAPVAWAVEKGVTTGTTPTTFSPSNTCTQAQILTFLYRAVGSPAVSGSSPFTNEKITSNQYYYNAMLWAAQKDIITDRDIDPNAPCTRADVVTYLWCLNEKPAATGGSAFTDVPASASYAQAVAWAVKEGITNGTSATTFSPTTTCTRAHIVTFLYRDLA